MRCLTLADALNEAGWETLFAIGPQSAATVPTLAKRPHIVVQGNPTDEAESIGGHVGSKVEFAIVDHYCRDAAFETECRRWAATILAIDDLADRRHDCDLLVDQTLSRAEADYAGLVPAHCRLLIGATYALLRPQFLARRSEAVRRRRKMRPAERLLMSFGATDPDGVTFRLLAALVDHAPSIAIDVVCGTSPSEQLRRLASAHAKRVILHHAVQDMASLMLAADLAVGAGGTTSWERCALGLPTAIVVLAENQRLIAGRLSAAGAALLLGDAETFDEVEAASRIVALGEDPDRLAHMSAAAFAICDGEGTNRVATQIQESIRAAH